jgi:hypothetical protein
LDDKKDSHVELHESLDEFDIEVLYDIFSKQSGKRFNAPMLRQVLESVGKVQFSDEEFNVMFMRMNVAR